MKARNIFALVAAAFMFAACEDYTEHNFGKPEELYQNTQVKAFAVTMDSAAYQTVANCATNKARALASDEELHPEAQADSTAYQLRMVGENAYFYGGVTPAKYLPDVMNELIGNGQYYATKGSTASVTFRQKTEGLEYLADMQELSAVTLEKTFTPSTLSELPVAITAAKPNAQKGDLLVVNYQYSDVDVPVGEEEERVPTYTKVTSNLVKSGKFLMVPAGTDIALANSNNEATGQEYSYGYIYATGSARFPNSVTRIDANSFAADDVANAYAYSIEKNGDAWLLCNGLDLYLYMKDTYNNFNYIDDLGELEDEEWPEWNISYNGDGTFDIVNTGNGKVLLYGTSYNSAGAYADKKGEDGYLGIELYQYVEPAKKAPRRSAINKLGYNASTLYTYNGSKWVEYTTKSATIEVVSPEAYVALGSNQIANPDYVLPIYLGKNLPYAEDGDVVAVVYKGTKGYVTEQYVLNGTAWTKSQEVETKSMNFLLEEDGWKPITAYLDQALTGGSSLTDMDLVYATYGWSVKYNGGIGDLTYVWKYDYQYGMRGSAYKSGAVPTDAWAITPTMNFKNATTPTFYFAQAQKYAGTPVNDYLQIWISTDYEEQAELNTATWVQLTNNPDYESKIEGTWPDGSSWNFYKMSIDLSEFAGCERVNVALRYVSTDAIAATWEVKDIICCEPADFPANRYKGYE